MKNQNQSKQKSNQILEKTEKNEKSKSVQKQVKKKMNQRLEKRLGEGSSRHMSCFSRWKKNGTLERERKMRPRAE